MYIKHGSVKQGGVRSSNGYSVLSGLGSGPNLGHHVLLLLMTLWSLNTCACLNPRASKATNTTGADSVSRARPGQRERLKYQNIACIEWHLTHPRPS